MTLKRDVGAEIGPRAGEEGESGSEAESTAQGGGTGRKGLVRRLYDWVLHWADRPSGPAALGVICAAEASFFPIPPDPLLMALCLGSVKKAFRFAAIATGASVLGGMLGYLIGASAWQALGGFFFTYVPGISPEGFEDIRAFYDRWDFFAVFLAGLTPMPYKLFTISAGVFSINFPVFVMASILSRGLRFFAEAALIFWFGPSISRFIDRYFNLLAWAFGILLVLGFVVIEFVL